MRRFLLGSLSVFLLLFAVSPVVRACINDREVSQSEREFKSSYEVQPNTGPYSPTEDEPALIGDWVKAIGATSLGSLLLVGAVTVTIRGTACGQSRGT